ncbi:hypothetical protein GWK47_016164 [Chionoecetes opilio]|uniref:Uncharacterized protein n=1 Tax=Chionoecetes opilio TaxID=41210 RepID=A0A8J4XRN2_CHIOP|nr:hypothetical protein GWK47_016164 [Chionoecetes opilio]
MRLLGPSPVVSVGLSHHRVHLIAAGVQNSTYRSRTCKPFRLSITPSRRPPFTHQCLCCGATRHTTRPTVARNRHPKIATCKENVDRLEKLFLGDTSCALCFAMVRKSPTTRDERSRLTRSPSARHTPPAVHVPPSVPSPLLTRVRRQLGRRCLTRHHRAVPACEPPEWWLQNGW